MKNRKKGGEELLNKNRGRNFPTRSVLQFNVSPQFCVYLASIADNVRVCEGRRGCSIVEIFIRDEC